MLRIRLKELREDKGISQAQLARNIGVGQSTVAMWENGKSTPVYKTLIKVANYFDVSVDFLTGKSDSQHPVSGEKQPATQTGDGPDDELLDLLSRIPSERIDEVRRYLRFQAGGGGTP